METRTPKRTSPKRLTLDMSEDMHTKLRHAAADRKTTIRAMMLQCVEQIILSEPDRTADTHPDYPTPTAEPDLPPPNASSSE